jgi:chloramphenicol-sensitive protein RarD
LSARAPRERLDPVGTLYATAAYLAYALFPIYWKALAHIDAVEILAHRIVWSLILVAAMVAGWRQLGALRDVLAALRPLAMLAVSALLLSCNWGLFIYAVNTDRVLEASLGYFINPLVSVLLGVVILRERLGPLQVAAVALAGIGVLQLGVARAAPPWIPLALAFSFGFYVLVRKMVAAGPLTGLLVETLLMTPLALGYLVWLAAGGAGAFLALDPATDVLLVLGGAVTALPLLWVTAGVRRLPYATFSQFQYIGPSGQFLLATLVFHEPFGTAELVAFACIWTAIALYLADIRRR